nr:hypothetical protein [Tanacetum cinerariifolium]
MNAARPKRTSFYKPAHSYVKRPFQRSSAVRTQSRVPRVSSVNRKIPTVNRKFPTRNSKVSTADLGNKGKAVKASACWIWKPRHNSTDKFLNSNTVSVIFKKYQYIDTQGRLKPINEDFSESNEEFSSTDDDSFSFDNIDYVEASPPDFEFVSSEVMEIVTPKVGGIKALNDNLILFYDPIIFGTLPNLTPSRESDFFSESCSDEDVLETIISKPLCEEEIIPMKSLCTHYSSLPISSKINSLLDEFT